MNFFSKSIDTRWTNLILFRTKRFRLIIIGLLKTKKHQIHWSGTSWTKISFRHIIKGPWKPKRPDGLIWLSIERKRIWTHYHRSFGNQQTLDGLVWFHIAQKVFRYIIGSQKTSDELILFCSEQKRVQISFHCHQTPDEMIWLYLEQKSF